MNEDGKLVLQVQFATKKNIFIYNSMILLLSVYCALTAMNRARARNKLAENGVKNYINILQCLYGQIYKCMNKREYHK